MVNCASDSRALNRQTRRLQLCLTTRYPCGPPVEVTREAVIFQGSIFRQLSK
ncbi:hypothetical protein MAR_013566 [Mya arenaria]|uniref:Uncharacterized protein n=1 Tax=Mya arenaria TaxID=6604 RepID=A0ABY7G099_MYAAR|nr:hypothetical protein MAR_013566 [Mya arenaria]